MAERALLVATAEQRAALADLASSRERGEADRARGVLLSLAGRSSAEIGRALLVRADTVRDWRGRFMAGGVEALWAKPRSGRPAAKGKAALDGARAILAAPGEVVWTLPRLRLEIARRTGITVSEPWLSRLLRKGALPGDDPGTRSRAGRTEMPSSGPASASPCCGSRPEPATSTSCLATSPKL